MPNWVDNTLRMPKKFAHLVVNKEQNVDFNILVHMPSSLMTDSSSYNDADVYLYLSNNNTISFNDVKSSSSAQIYYTPIGIVNAVIYKTLDERITDAYHHVDSLLTEINSKDPNEIKQAIANTNPDFTHRYDIEKRFQHGEMIFNNVASYGAPTWYEWSLRNWGCKWNASNTSIEDDENDPDYIIVSFNTPWSPPFPWLKTLFERNVDFTCEWIEESGFAGTYTSANGEFTSENREITYDDCDDDDDSSDDDD